MDKVIKYMNKNKNIVIDGKLVFELEQELKRKEQENEELKKSIDRIMQNKEIKTIDLDIAIENERLKARLRPLEDSYFKGLSSIEIAELAKKSIRITAENRKLEDALQEIRDIADENKDTAQYRGICISIISKINEVIGAE